MLSFEDSFFQSETRDGFTVSEMMKRCWAVQMNVLMDIDRICCEYGLSYFAISGTMLGAVRHKGYVPWDDDIDIAMLRDDYMRFIEVSRYELPEGYYVHSYYTCDTHRNSPTGIMNRSDGGRNKAITEHFYGCPYITGVDLHPIDFVPLDDNEKQVFEATYGLLYDTAITCDGLDRQALIEKLKLVEQFTGVKIDEADGNVRQKLWILSERVASMYSEAEARGAAWIPDLVTISPERYFSIEAVKQTIYMPFEMIQIPIPVGYDEYLRVLYGEDYMTPRNITASHGYPFYKDQQAYNTQ